MQDPDSPSASVPPSTGIFQLLVVPLLVVLPGYVLQRAAQKAGYASAFLVFNWVFYLVWGLWALHVGRRAGLRMQSLAARPQRRALWALVLLAIPLLAITVSALFLQILALSRVFPRVAISLLGPSEVGAGAHSLWTPIVEVTGATLVPAVEETVFRGVLLNLWARRWGLRSAVIWSSLVFAVLHLDPIGSFIFGVVMVGLYASSGSLLVPVVTHALYNAAALIDTSDDTGMSLADLHSYSLPSLAAFVGGIVLVWFALRVANRGPWQLPNAFREPISQDATDRPI
jgi:uncharacterized protein